MEHTIVEKIYEVEFLSYTNHLKDTVSDWNGEDHSSETLKNLSYLQVKNPFLVKESDLDYFRKFGTGFRSVKFVGYLTSPVPVINVNAPCIHSEGFPTTEATTTWASTKD